MGWDERRRKRAIDAVLAHVERFPSDGLPFEQLPSVTEVFCSRAELLRALQRDWSASLWMQIDLIGHVTNSRLMDAGHVCRLAWDETARRRPTLRRLLDDHQDEIDLVVA